MSVQFHDPRGEAMTPAEPYRLGTAMDGDITIGLLANGFPDSVNFLDQVETALARRMPGARFQRYDKGDASRLASPDMLDDIAASCQAVVAAYGH